MFAFYSLFLSERLDTLIRHIVLRNLSRQGLFGGSLVVDLFFYVPPIVCGGFVLSLVWYALLYVLSSFAIILTRKRELVALLLLSFRCLVIANVL